MSKKDLSTKEWSEIALFSAGVAVGAVLSYGLMALACAFCENTSVSDPDPSRAGDGRTFVSGIASGRDRLDYCALRQSDLGAELGAAQDGFVNSNRNNSKGHGADIGNDDLERAGCAISDTNGLNACARDVKFFLPQNCTNGSVCGDACRSCGDRGANERSDRQTIFHAADYTTETDANPLADEGKK